MQTLTSNQIGLIRLALTRQARNAERCGAESIQGIESIDSILDILEYGCGVSVLSCEEESQRLIDTAIPSNDHAWAPEAEMVDNMSDDIPPVFLSEGI